MIHINDQLKVRTDLPLQTFEFHFLCTRFSQVFASLPLEAQQNFVEKHLPALLNHIPKEKAKKGEVPIDSRLYHRV